MANRFLKFGIIGIIILLTLVAAGLFWKSFFGGGKMGGSGTPLDFIGCQAAGYPVQESYPRQCRTPDGRILIEDIGNEFEKRELIRAANPRPNQKISSPLIIRGEARGTWFFEASFPVKLLDGDGNLIATAIAQAQGDWMTADFVPFQAVLEFRKELSGRGKILLIKDNPSGLPQNDDQLVVPVVF